MAKKIVAYCGIEDDSWDGYLKWDKNYLEMSHAQKLKFVTDVINELAVEHRFLIRIIDNLKTASKGLGLPQ